MRIPTSISFMISIADSHSIPLSPSTEEKKERKHSRSRRVHEVNERLHALGEGVRERADGSNTRVGICVGGELGVK